MFFYREPAPAPTTFTFVESFEFAEGWSGTIANLNYYLSYSFNAANSQQDSFETSEGW
jgi:hypothetical protein